MNSLIIKGNWNEAAGKLKQQFANLTMMIYFFKKVRKKNYWEDCRINLERLKKNYEV